MICSAGVLEPDFAVTGLLALSQVMCSFQVLATARTRERLAVAGQVFDIGEVVLIEVEE